MKTFIPFLLACSLFETIASASIVRSPLSLLELANNSDLIVKATVISTQPGKETWLKGNAMIPDMETKLRVISVIDSSMRDSFWLSAHPISEVKTGPKGGDILRFEHLDEMPSSFAQLQYYRFQPGSSYIVFMRHLPGAPADVFTQVYFSSHSFSQGALRCANDHPVKSSGIKQVFLDELKSLASVDPAYCIEQLDEYSHRAPYQEFTPMNFPERGIERDDPDAENQGLSDFSSADARRILWDLSAIDKVLADPDAMARESLAHVVTYTQVDHFAPALNTMLSDREERVRMAAAVALLSFPAGHESIDDVLRQHRSDPEMGQFFLVRLEKNYGVTLFLPELAKLVGGPRLSFKWSGPIAPQTEGDKMLWAFMYRQSNDAIKAGKFDDCLNALANCPTSPAQQPYVYAFYKLRGLNDEAARFRQAVEQKMGTVLDATFDDVDRDPARYFGS